MKLNEVHIGIFFKDFAHWIRSSCVGLNVAGYSTAKYLKQMGVDATGFAVKDNIGLVTAIDCYNQTHKHPMTHAVISAPWLAIWDLKSLLTHYPDMQFVILSHSNVGFLQADPGAVKLFRLYIELASEYSNLHIGGNCAAFSEWLALVYRTKTVLLPNLYPVQRVPAKHCDSPSVLHIGAFGAIRPEKNFMTAAGAALLLTRKFKVPIRFHMSSGGENCRSNVIPAIQEMFIGVPGITLEFHEWQTWDKFILLVSSMDLMLQPSYTESFNMVTADGISEGVPSVVSTAVRWAPKTWQADSDDVTDVAGTAFNLLLFPQAYKGYNALARHNQQSMDKWKEFLTQ